MSSPPRRVLVDDTDSRILYSSSWVSDSSGIQDQVGNFGPAFNSTLHGAFGDGTAQFEFTGTSVDVYGSSVVQPKSGPHNPNWICHVDDVIIPSTALVQFPENNWQLCNTTGLSDSHHTLSITASSHGNPFWLDYILYTPSAGAVLKNFLIKVEDSDSSMHFDSSWQRLANFATMADTKGSTMEFNFTGIGVSMYGMYPKERPYTPSLASYSIDGGPDIGFALKGLQPKSESVYNQLFFQSAGLPEGPHTLTVKYLSDKSSTPLVVDYVLVQTGDEAASTSTAPSSNLPSTTGTVVDPTPSLFGASSTGMKPGSIVGIVLGVLASVLILLVLAIVAYRYRKRKPRAIRESFTIASPYPRFSRREPGSPQTSSTASLRGIGTSYNHNIDYAPSPLPNHRKRTSHPRAEPQAGESLQTQTTQVKSADLGDSDSYYGGYQTWKDAKEQEANFDKSSRNSYI